MRPFTAITVVGLVIVSVLHASRLLLGWDIAIAGWEVPVGVSVIGFVITAGLALMVWREWREASRD